MDPLDLLFPTDSVGTAQITSAGNEPVSARFELLLDFQASLFADPNAGEFRFDLEGSIGVDANLVPEPGTALLVSLGLVVLAGSRRTRGMS